MKKQIDKQTMAKAGTKRVYLDEEAESILDLYAVKLDIHRSNVVAALLRGMDGKPPRKGEEGVFRQLKKIFGREQFLAFLNGVAAVLPESAKPVDGSDGKAHDREFTPDTWRIAREGITIFAYFAPGADIVGKIMHRVADLQKKCPAEKVIVVTPFVSPELEEYKEPFARMGVMVVAVGNFKETFHPRYQKKAESKKKK